WRLGQALKAGATVRYNIYAEAADVMAERPDVVFIATGGLPNLSFLEAGADLVTTSWGIFSGAAKPAETGPLFDDAGTDAAMTVAEFIAKAETRLEIATPERGLAVEVGGMNYPAYFKTLS